MLAIGLTVIKMVRSKSIAPTIELEVLITISKTNATIISRCAF